MASFKVKGVGGNSDEELREFFESFGSVKLELNENEVWVTYSKQADTLEALEHLDQLSKWEVPKPLKALEYLDQLSPGQLSKWEAPKPPKKQYSVADWIVQATAEFVDPYFEQQIRELKTNPIFKRKDEELRKLRGDPKDYSHIVEYFKVIQEEKREVIHGLVNFFSEGYEHACDGIENKMHITINLPGSETDLDKIRGEPFLEILVFEIFRSHRKNKLVLESRRILKDSIKFVFFQL